jgi:5-dehydro-4-deoxyglucarate dehydratase
LLAPEELKQRLPGALVFAPTPFVPETLELDLSGLRRNLEFLAEGGIEAVAVAGFVGDCVMLLPPYLVEPTEEGLVAHTRAVAEATRLGVMVHSMPGYPFTARLVERLAAIPGVVSYKDELGDVRGFADIVDHVGDQLVYVNGRAEPVMAYYAAAGATVLATAIGNFDPALALEAYAAADRKDFEGMRAVLAPRAMAWYRLRERNRGFLISVSKASMNLMGLAGGSVRPPLSDLRPDVERELIDLLTETKYLEVTR